MEKLFFKLSRRAFADYLVSINYKDGEVLDAGCGYGFYSEFFGKNYTGIDKDVSAIKRARRLYPEKKFEVMDAADLKFANEKFELIFSNLVFHHVDDTNLTKAMESMSGALKNGGHIFIIDMVLPENFKFLARLFFYLDDGALARTAEGLVELLRGHNLRLENKITRLFLGVRIVVLEYRKNIS